MRYFYKFNNMSDKKPSETAICDQCPDGFIMFGNGEPVDWGANDHNGIGGLVDVEIEETAIVQPATVELTDDQIAEQRKAVLDNMLASNKTKLTSMVSEGILTGNDTEITLAKDSWFWLTSDYQNKLAQINAGNDCWSGGNDGW